MHTLIKVLQWFSKFINLLNGQKHCWSPDETFCSLGCLNLPYLELLRTTNPLENVAECPGNPGANLPNRAWRFMCTRVPWSHCGCISLRQESSVSVGSLAASLASPQIPESMLQSQQWKMSPALPNVPWDQKLLMRTDTWEENWFGLGPDIN